MIMKIVNLIFGIFIIISGIYALGMGIFVFVADVNYWGFYFYDYAGLLIVVFISLLMIIYGCYLISKAKRK